MRDEQEHRGGLWQRQAQDAGGFIAGIGEAGQRRIDIPERWAEAGQEPDASVGRRDAARGAVEKSDAETLLEGRYAVTYGRGRNANGLAGAAKSAASHDFGK